MGELDGTVFSLSKKDVMGGKVYPPSWYRVHIDDVTTSPSKNVEKPSTNITYSGTILFDADSGDKEFADHPATWLFNSRALGFTKGFLVSLGVPESDITEDKRFDFKAAIGKDIDIYIENDTYEGRLVNRINHKYRAVRSA
jgi:hypothetical protein